MTTPDPADLYTTGAQAHAALDEGRLSDAAALYGWVLALARREGDAASEAAALHQLGIIASRRGQRDEAHDLYGQSLAIKQELGNRAGQSATLHELGRLALEAGDLADAVRYLNESLDIARQVGDPASLIYTLDLRGQLARLGDDPALAATLYHEALDLAESIGRADLAAPAAASLGDLAVLAGDLAGAAPHYDLARAYYRAVRDEEGEAGARLSLAALAQRRGDFAVAQREYEAVLDLTHRAGGDSAGGDSAWWDSAPALDAAPSTPPSAFRIPHSAFHIPQWAAAAAARALYSLGSLANRRGDYTEAMRYAEQALTLARALDDRRLGGTAIASLGMATMNAASTHKEQAAFRREVIRAFRAWAAALELLEPLGVPEVAQYHEWVRQAGPVYREIAARGGLAGARAEWWPDA